MILANLLKQVFTTRRTRAVDISLAEVHAALDANDLEGAHRKITAALAATPHNAEVLLAAGLVAFNRGHYAETLVALHKAESQTVSRADCAYIMAHCHFALGDMPAARACCEAALHDTADHLSAHSLLAAISLPGPVYIEVLSAIHRIVQPSTYLEIGVFEGQSLEVAHPRTTVIGVDPAPQINKPLGENVRIFAMTSDAYFSERDVLADCRGQPLDLAFIDGMHLFDFALRDFANIERYCTRNATVLVHDCFPLDRRTAERERVTTFSSGDVWKMILALKKYRPDLKIDTIATRPTGLAVIRNLDPESPILREQMDQIVADYAMTDYGVLDQNKQQLLNLFPNDFAKIETLLKPIVSNGCG